ncbi:rhamnogalacturonan acetylesterase [Marinoscillum furvescens]|uniref:Lysophospholipase L1-like esterase n=1 Tax=Marinoscillum furvescens DSM 4134 TaxID=1122208 RepID=A0A3D9LGM0_MARFU|nr:rhamnogalacturonan acetylesterase [Marinoscillum furvescens]REE05511.1 lysophospholipase L1-like esterase [Marinoscillum furvescens DSM 4134]
MTNRIILSVVSLWIITSFIPIQDKPTLYLIGDSTVKNGSGQGADKLWGWGSILADYLDTSQVRVVNKAIGGRSSRTFITEGRWKSVHDNLQPGDIVLIQFGHNDGGAINDDFRARGTIKGNGEEFMEIDNLLTKRREVVKSYGWYLRKYIADTKAKGATPIVCSLVARNQWDGNKVKRSDYAKWAEEAAKQEGAYFINLHELVAEKYEKLGQGYVTDSLFLEDHTHTNRKGATINAQIVALALSLLQDESIPSLVK